MQVSGVKAGLICVDVDSDELQPTLFPAMHQRLKQHKTPGSDCTRMQKNSDHWPASSRMRPGLEACYSHSLPFAGLKGYSGDG